MYSEWDCVQELQGYAELYNKIDSLISMHHTSSGLNSSQIENLYYTGNHYNSLF